MAAIITENFRRNNAALFLNDITSSPPVSEYYLGIGKQDAWAVDEAITPVPVPIGSRADELEVLSNLTTLVALNSLEGAVGRVIPTVTWRTAVSYKAYSSYDSSRFYPTGTVQPCYVTIQGNIFMCLKAGSGNSTIAPSVQSPNKYAPFQLFDGAGNSDGYVWVLIQEAAVTPIIRTNTFTDVSNTALAGDPITIGTAAYASKTQCGGLVSGFTVVNGGSGYVSGTSVFKLRRNDGFPTGTAATATAVINVSGVVTSVTINTGGSGYTSPPAVTFPVSPTGVTATGTAVINGSGVVTGVTINNGGSGYSTAPAVTFDFSADDLTLTATIETVGGVAGVVTSVSYSGNPSTYLKGATFASVDKSAGPGTGAIIIPTIAPTNGFAYIPAAVMPSWFAGLVVKLDDNINGDSFYTRYRQISIVKNPTTKPGFELTDGLNESTTLNALKSFSFADGVTLPSLDANGSIITDSNNNVIGFADHVINTTGNKKIFFHQNSVSGYRELPSTGSIKIGVGTPATYAYNAINTGEFVNDGKAEVLFTENRSFITRTAGQLEDLILIIQF